jgi:WhiB family redox-sensing transcriptional regulator
MIDSEVLLQASCLNEDIELFYPEGRSQEAEIATAKDICCQCPIVALCLAQALVDKEEFGIWGGATPEERVEMLREPKMREFHLKQLKDRAEAPSKKQNKLK